MNEPFYETFFPKIIQVLHREKSYWVNRNFEVTVPSTSMHNFSYIYNGKGILEIDGSRHLLKSGSIFQFSSGSSIKLTSNSNMPLNYYTVYYTPAFVEFEGFRPFFNTPERTNLPYDHVFLVEAIELTEHMKRLYEMWQEKKIGFGWKSRLEFMSIVRLCEECLSSKSRNDEPYARLIDEIMEYMKINFHDDLKREVLSEKFSLSTSFFSVLFKKHTDYTPNEYVNILRLEYAKKRLRSTNDPIQNIAIDAGFNDPLYFSKVFSKKIGMSPRNYRNG